MQNNENRRRGAVAALVVATGIAIGATACGGSGTSGSDPSASAPSSASSSASAQSPATRALAYAQCMRSHGVPNFPDPTINGNSISMNVDVNSLDVSQSVLSAAQNDCASLSPQSFVPPGFNQAKNTAEGLKWAQCIREHGEPDFPDPSGDGTFNLPSSINAQGPALQAAENACKSLTPMQVQMRSGNGLSGTGGGS
jgi:hypothetical protein